MGQYYPFFKAYDVRAQVPNELNCSLARQIGLAYVAEIGAKTVVVGHDMRLSSPALAKAIIDGLTAAGANVLDIGLCGTEEVAFACFNYQAEGGIMVTASHNPAHYNGLKFLREKAKPISSDDGLFDIERRVYNHDYQYAKQSGKVQKLYHRDDYIEFLLSQVDLNKLKSLNIVANPGNGCAGIVVEPLAQRLPFAITSIYADPDGRLPNGVPNPLLPENRATTAAKVRETGADFGVAWDGDFDRCFFFDENGEFIEGYYLVGLIAETLLKMHPNSKIVHDPRLIWNTQAQVQAKGGETVVCKSGHAFMKAKMRHEDALYGGEMSAHHYFRDFAYADNGHLPWLLIAQLLSTSNKSLSELVRQRIEAYPVSGEINRTIKDSNKALAEIEKRYADQAQHIEHIDGLSVDCGDWRFNLRQSNTEPVVRLNVEARGNSQLMKAKTAELLAQIEQF